MASIYGGWSGVSSDVTQRFYVTFDHSSQADSNGNIRIYNVRIYFQYKNNQSSHFGWRRNTCTLSANGSSTSWGGSYTYTSMSGTYSSACNDMTVYVGRNGGNVTLSLSGSATIMSGTQPTYSSNGSITISVKAYEEPAPTYALGTLYANTDSPFTMGDKVNFIISPKDPSLTNEIVWSCNGASGNTGLTNDGEWTVSTSTFEPLVPDSNEATITFTLKQYANGSLVGQSSKTISAKVPDEYMPDLKFGSYSIRTKIVGDDTNGYIVMDRNYLDINLEFSMYPSGNSARIVDAYVFEIIANPTIPRDEFITWLQLENNILSILKFPKITEKSSYTVAFRVRVLDSRGRETYATIDSSTFGRVYGYIPPKIGDFDIHRCNVDGFAKPNGTYAFASVNVDSESQIEICSVEIGNASYNLIKQENSNTYSAIIGGGVLDIGTQYEAILSVRNELMRTYGDLPLIKSGFLPTMQMPISLLDSDYQVGVSIGEMAVDYDDTDAKIVNNFGLGTYLRATDEEGNSIVVPAFNAINNANCPYPIGSIFVTTADDDPSTLFPNTSWTKLADTTQYGVSVHSWLRQQMIKKPRITIKGNDACGYKGHVYLFDSVTFDDYYAAETDGNEILPKAVIEFEKNTSLFFQIACDSGAPLPVTPRAYYVIKINGAIYYEGINTGKTINLVADKDYVIDIQKYKPVPEVTVEIVNRTNYVLPFRFESDSEEALLGGASVPNSSNTVKGKFVYGEYARFLMNNIETGSYVVYSLTINDDITHKDEKIYEDYTGDTMNYRQRMIRNITYTITIDYGK